jgi:Tol biopolymer transport system component/DNA-binding winged helix-turn-helix (wHTH) protein
MTDQQKRPDSRAARSRRGVTRIGEWLLYPDIGVLRGTAGEVRLNPKTLHVLLVLLDAGDQGVSRETLLDQVWGESYPSDGVVSRAMADLRAAFGEKAGEQRYIRTIPKFGYQFVAVHNPESARPQKSEKLKAPDRRRNPALLPGVVLLAIVIGWFFSSAWNAGPEAPVQVLAGQRPLTSDPGLEHQPRFIPHSEWIVYAFMRTDRNDWDLFRVSRSDGISQPVAVTPGVHEHGPAVSPGGEELAYVRISDNACDVVVQSITLGVPKQITTCTEKFATLVDWSPDDNWLAYTIAQRDDKDHLRRIYLVNRFTGDTRRLTDAVSATGTDFYPRFSPSGSKLAFLRGEPQPDHRTTIWVVDALSGEETQLTTLPAQTGGMTWLDENRLLYSTSDGGPVRGRWIDLQDGTSHAIESAEFVHPEYSVDDGYLVAAERRTDSDLVVLSTSSVERSVARSTGDDHHGTWSPDEQWIAFVSTRSGFDELWIAESEGELTRQLTRFDGAAVRYPDWHPDDQRILFTAQTESGEKLYEIDVVSGSPRRIETGFEEITTPRWLADGDNWIAGCRNSSGWGICVSNGSNVDRVADGYYRPQPSTDDHFYAVNDAGILFSLTLGNGDASEVWDGLPGNGRYGWAVEDNFIYFFAGSESGNASRLIRRDRSGGAMELLYEGPMPIADMNLSIGTVSGEILFTRFQTSSDDLVLYERVTID